MLSRHAFRAAIAAARPTTRSVHLSTARPPTLRPAAATLTPATSPVRIGRRWVSTKELADEKVEELTELYNNAKDEFELAMEETEKMTVYAEDDRAAAREELEKVLATYKEVVEGKDEDLGKEVSRRVGQRLRELEQGVKAMEELAMNQD